MRLPSEFQNIKLAILALAMSLGVIASGGQLRAAEAKTVTVAGGCFWCVESDFESVRGVIKAVSGFSGGSVANPTYKQVTKGGTGHYEAVQITYDPAKISTDQIYAMFLRSIDPTDAGGQFCDRGESYRTAIFVSSDAERASARAAIDAAKAELGRSVVTPVLDAGEFYPAGRYHQDYYKSNAVILTRFGPLTKAKAYKRYREACGRDQRVKELWGSAAPFAG